MKRINGLEIKMSAISRRSHTTHGNVVIPNPSLYTIPSMPDKKIVSKER